MDSRNRIVNGLSFIGVISLFALLVAFGGVESAVAAPLLQEGSSVWGAVIQRMIVIAGATLLLSLWGKWRDRRNNKQD
ncbi:MAG: hypothetical protein GY943_17990 [Chloroflexi bacterium]|nr:hypothetical protein [Chloroflexota bacterium]